MAAGAGSLNVLIGGPAVYHGVLETRPTLGAGHTANAKHVVAALRLVERATLMWLAVLLIIAVLSATTSG
jgi:adenosylcobinamide-phosphate synthase